jgi:hypothetical protein
VQHIQRCELIGIDNNRNSFFAHGSISNQFVAFGRHINVRLDSLRVGFMKAVQHLLSEG